MSRANGMTVCAGAQLQKAPQERPQEEDSRKRAADKLAALAQLWSELAAERERRERGVVKFKRYVARR